MSTVFYPQFVVPVLGLQVGGISEFIYPRPILYLAIALILHQGGQAFAFLSMDQFRFASSGTILYGQRK